MMDDQRRQAKKKQDAMIEEGKWKQHTMIKEGEWKRHEQNELELFWGVRGGGRAPAQRRPCKFVVFIYGV
jgi:hypothetical protein